MGGYKPSRYPAGVFTKFYPRDHGFPFKNRQWPGDILIDIPILGRVNFGDTSYGLCGGMVYAALDTFLCGGTQPEMPKDAPSGSQARSYLYTSDSKTASEVMTGTSSGGVCRGSQNH